MPLVASCGSSTQTPQPSEDDLKINIVAFNDFHGAIFEDGNRMGLAALGSYLKYASDKKNTLIFSQGDDWQGSIYSNHNRGRLINDVYAYCHVDARIVGNHDFDWGIEPLIENTKTGYDGYVTPVLAANVYDYNFETKVEGNIQQSDIGVPTYTYELENGLKVGVVGVIGEDQITSITSSFTVTICFKDHIQAIKEHATRLKEEGCDIVIASVHAGQESVLYHDLNRYVDLVLCGHSHRKEEASEGSLNYFQFGCYGQYIGNIELTYNTKTKETRSRLANTITKSNVRTYVPTFDTTITGLIHEYKSQCDEEANVVVASNVNGSFDRNETGPNLMAKAMFDQAISEGHDDIILSYTNSTRSYLPYGSWTYADIYETFPFDNAVYIEEVSGLDILYEIPNFNNVYLNPTFDLKIDPNKSYKICTLDYLLYHTNNTRDYNYFHSFDGEPDATLSMNYRLILREWLVSNGYSSGRQINSYDFSSSLDCFNGSRLQQI